MSISFLSPRYISKVLVIAVSIFAAGSVARAQAISEGFESLSNLTNSGDWFVFNHSVPVNEANPGWFQCSGNQIAPAQGGSTNSCVSANFDSGQDVATLNDWLIGPVRTFNNGDEISFWARELAGNPYPNRMQVRLSLSGDSTNVGVGANDVGDFTELLLDINPSYEIGGFPDHWTLYNITIIGLDGPTSGRFAFRYFVENGGPDGDNSYIIGIDTLTYTPVTSKVNTQHVFDFDGDGKTDYAVVRNDGGGPQGQVGWYIRMNGGPADTCGDGNICRPWGLASDFFVPADYDGDQKTDIAVWRGGPPDQGYFYIFESATNTFRMEQVGQDGDDPTVVGDYTGDGKADPAVYREGTNSGEFSYWHYKASSGPLVGQFVATHFGQNGDFPAPGDYDGDGKNDFCVQRSAGGGYAVYYIHKGTGGADVQVPDEDRAIWFGRPSDLIVPGDWDGDGKTDIATIHSNGGQIEWQYHSSLTDSGNGFSPNFIWGSSTSDFAVPGDYDGDGKLDAAVFRPNADPDQNYFYVISSQNGSPITPFAEWGSGDDYPVANANTH
jgi:hypothetical protein